jgi:hypothetical protein
MKTTTKRNGNRITEKDVEAYGKKKLAEIFFKSEKFSSPNNKGVPDQLVTGVVNIDWPVPLTFFVEYKAPYEKPTHLQKLDHRERRSRGYYVFVVDCFEHVDLMVDFIFKVAYTKVLHPHPDELL